MRRRYFTTDNFLALLLPLSFFWGWAACTALCEENNGVSAGRIALATVTAEVQNCPAFDAERDECQISAMAALVQERQNAAEAAAFAPALPDSPYRAPLAARLSTLPEIKSNSPPKILSSPHLKLLCSLRI